MRRKLKLVPKEGKSCVCVCLQVSIHVALSINLRGKEVLDLMQFMTYILPCSFWVSWRAV